MIPLTGNSPTWGNQCGHTCLVSASLCISRGDCPRVRRPCGSAEVLLTLRFSASMNFRDHQEGSGEGVRPAGHHGPCVPCLGHSGGRMKTVSAPGLSRCRSSERRIPLGAERKDDPFPDPGSLTSLCTLIKQQVRTDATHAQSTLSFDRSGSRVRKKRCMAETLRFVGAPLCTQKAAVSLPRGAQLQLTSAPGLS